LRGRPCRKEPIMGRPNKYPDQFRRDALELEESSERPIADGGPLVGDRRGHVVELGASGS
jgi:hypothetical protein